MIFTSMGTKKHIVFEYLEYFCKNSGFVSRNIKLMRKNKNEVLVCFTNGSFIRVVSASDNAKGHRANNIVIDTDITNKEIIDNIIRPVIADLLIELPKRMTGLFGTKPYRIKRFKKVEYTVKI